MITHRVTVTCERAAHALAGACPTLTPDDPSPETVEVALAEAGWSTRDGKHYCPRHDPDETGEHVTVTTAGYTHLGRGVWARVPWSPFPVGISTIEVQMRTRTLEDLAAEQGVSPIESIDELAGPADVPPEEMDAFLAAIHERVDPQRDEIERRLRVATDTVARVRQLAITWSASPDGTLRQEASRILHETLDGPADEPGTEGGRDD